MKVSVYIAISSNGLISNRRGVPDWLSPEFGRGFMEICQTTKAVIMGKRTYDLLAPGNLPLTDEGISVVLTSHTDAAPVNPTVSFTDDSPAEIVALLEEKGVPEAVIIGGATVISEFVIAGLVSDLIMVMEPVLFGGGLPLLKDVGQDYELQLVDTKKLSDNTLRLHYQVGRKGETS